jgi:hypothetical protein
MLTGFHIDDLIIERDSNGKPRLLDPLAWWHGQRMLGNKCKGLTQMVLDVLSIPGG